MDNTESFLELNPVGIYVFDTSSFRVIEHYFPGTFPSFWKRFDNEIAQGTIISVREVCNELERKNPKDHFKTWYKHHQSKFLKPPTREETQFVKEIFNKEHFKQLIDQQAMLNGYPVADPWVIAAAKVKGGSVVTEEVYKENAAKIPNVCRHFGIPCTNVEGFLAQKGWKF